MPIKISKDLPAKTILNKENIFTMTDELALKQDIRPLKIVILNLMPKKIETETQLLRLLGNTALQVDIELLQTASYTSKNTSPQHLLKFYKTFDQIKDLKFDGMIITGAPVEHLEFNEVEYWDELTKIMDWTETNVYSTLHICWGAQASLYYNYGIGKIPLDQKMFGIFSHNVIKVNHKLMRGFDEVYYAPHSRHTIIDEAAVFANDDLIPLSISDEAGINVIVSKNGRRVYVTGHSEYDRETLANEYFRDISKGESICIPKNYFPNDDIKIKPKFMWRAHANLLFNNWLNYFVYQQTPFDLNKL